MCFHTFGSCACLSAQCSTRVPPCSKKCSEQHVPTVWQPTAGPRCSSDCFVHAPYSELSSSLSPYFQKSRCVLCHCWFFVESLHCMFACRSIAASAFSLQFRNKPSRHGSLFNLSTEQKLNSSAALRPTHNACCGEANQRMAPIHRQRMTMAVSHGHLGFVKKLLAPEREASNSSSDKSSSLTESSCNKIESHSSTSEMCWTNVLRPLEALCTFQDTTQSSCFSMLTRLWSTFEVFPFRQRHTTARTVHTMPHPLEPLEVSSKFLYVDLLRILQLLGHNR